MEGIPIHDEQGTRDRPYDLTVDFLPEKIDELLQALGQKPWTARRPTIVVMLAVKYEAKSYLLTGDADEGFDQRESFMSAAWLTGMPMTLPSAAAFSEAGMTAEKLPTADIWRTGENCAGKRWRDCAGWQHCMEQGHAGMERGLATLFIWRAASLAYPEC